jgi:hypothetical protein
VEELIKKVGKLNIEEQVEQELKEFFSKPHSLEDEVTEVTRKEGRHALSSVQILTILLHVLMEGTDYVAKLKAREIFFKAVGALVLLLFLFLQRISKQRAFLFDYYDY